MRILGIDPGLRVTGFGVIDKHGSELTYVTSGRIRTSDGALDALRHEIPFATYAASADGPALSEGIDVYECLTALGVAASRGAAKRLLEQGGVSINGTKLSAADRLVGEDRLLRGRHLLLKKGAREFGLIRVP